MEDVPLVLVANLPLAEGGNSPVRQARPRDYGMRPSHNSARPYGMRPSHDSARPGMKMSYSAAATGTS